MPFMSDGNAMPFLLQQLVRQFPTKRTIGLTMIDPTEIQGAEFAVLVCGEEHIHVAISGLAPLVQATTALLLGWAVALACESEDEIPDLIAIGKLQAAHTALAKFLRSVEAHFVYQSFEAQRGQLSELCVVNRGGPALH